MINEFASVLVVGATGQLGSEICREFSGANILAPSHGELPIERQGEFAAYLEKHAPDLVINCSAFHQLDKCEADPERAFALNAVMVGAASRLCASRDIPFVTISTDYVFTGDLGRAYEESDMARPVNVYGASKLAGEALALAANDRCFVFRISGVFGRTGYSNKGPTFVELMISKAERGEPIKVVDNIVFSPTYTVDAARAIRQVVERESGGLLHVTNSGQCSWYDLAVEAITAAGLTATIERAQYQEVPGAIKRPIFSPLSSVELKRRGYADLPSWQSAVRAYVEERKARSVPA